MDLNAKQQLRQHLRDLLAKHGDHDALADDESIFLSGRLDSFSMMMLVMRLEEAFGLDFADVDFDVELVDSVERIEALVDARQAA